MHVSMTQGVVAVDISLTAEEARHLATILNWSDRLWKDGCEVAAEVEKTGWALWNQLDDAGIRKVDGVELRPLK